MVLSSLLMKIQKLPIIELFESDTYANKHNLKPDFIKTLENAYKGQMRDRYLLGKWAAFEGLVHPGFDTSMNLLKRDQMLDHLADCKRRHVRVQTLEGYDFGIATPTCYILAFVDDFGRVLSTWTAFIILILMLHNMHPQ